MREGNVSVSRGQRSQGRSVPAHAPVPYAGTENAASVVIRPAKRPGYCCSDPKGIAVRPRASSDLGQSSVEFAFVMPLVMLLLMALLQVGVMVKDQLLVLGAAREGVREAIVNQDHGQIQSAAGAAAPGLKLDRVWIERGSQRGDPARVEVTASPSKLPLVGQMVTGVTLKASATMRLERSDDA